MRYVTREQYEREVTSWQNNVNTKRLLRIVGRPPTIVELRSTYLLENIIVQTDKKGETETRT